MELETIVTLLLIIGGAIMMLLAIIGTRRIFQSLFETRYRKNWRVLQYLMFFFLLGYVAAGIIVWLGHTEILSFLTGIVFFFGAAFVYLTTRAGLNLMQGLTDHSKKTKEEARKLKSSKRTLKTINAELSAQNEELLKFNHVAAHDLQAPLHNISSIITLLEQDHMHEFGDDAKEYLSFISRSSERMRNLIIALLDYSRIGNDKSLQELHTEDVLNDVLEDQSTLLKEHSVDIKFDDLPIIKGHRIELTQLFQNLLTNALKFAKKGCTPVIKISATNEKDHWQFSFSDNGIGIEDKDKDRIFEMFKRIHSLHEYEGSGIGLANCKKIVELHNGNIWVESTIGEGSTFYFTIAK